MTEPEDSVAKGAGIRVNTDTLRRRFAALVIASVVLHLLFTPVAGWVGIIGALLSAEEDVPPPEELDAIPIELLDEAADRALRESQQGLPEEDPVEMIDELMAVPEAPAPAPEGESDAEAEQRAAEAANRLAEERRKAEAKAKEQARLREEAQKRAEAARRKREAERQQGDAGALPQDAGTTKLAKKQVGVTPPKTARRTIENPVAMVGKAGEVAKSNANLQLILYTSRIRHHAVGERIERILPRLPQWNDFFGNGELSPIQDFDQLFVAGPSFYYSQHLFIALSYNTERRKVHRAIDRLVQRDGHWLKNTPMPAALARADRAERLFVMPEGKMVYVAPPKLRRQAFSLGSRGLPPPSGDEALVALIKNPAKSFWQVPIQIPKTVHDLRIRLTPLPKGAVKLELSAQEDTEELARVAAHHAQKGLDAQLDMLSGFSNILGSFGLGGLTRGMKLPRLVLQTTGKEIHGSVVLEAEHVNFVLDRVDRQVAYWESQAKQRAAQKTKAPTATPPRKGASKSPQGAPKTAPKAAPTPKASDNSQPGRAPSRPAQPSQ